MFVEFSLKHPVLPWLECFLNTAATGFRYGDENEAGVVGNNQLARFPYRRGRFDVAKLIVTPIASKAKCRDYS